MGLASLQIKKSNNTDVLLNIGLKLDLSNIILNLCSKLSNEVLPKSSKLHCVAGEVDSFV